MKKAAKTKGDPDMLAEYDQTLRFATEPSVRSARPAAGHCGQRFSSTGRFPGGSP